jgi:hypothetical protein
MEDKKIPLFVKNIIKKNRRAAIPKLKTLKQMYPPKVRPAGQTREEAQKEFLEKLYKDLEAYGSSSDEEDEDPGG